MLRFGTELVPVPDWVSPEAQAVVQDLADKGEWYIAAGFDAVGFSTAESDRRAASTMVGGLTGWYAGTAVVGATAGLGSCLAGMAFGGVIGAVVSGPAAPLGAFVGGLSGCIGTTLVVGLPLTVAGGVVGAGIGAGAAAALGTSTNEPPAESGLPAESGESTGPPVDPAPSEGDCPQTVPADEPVAVPQAVPVAARPDPVAEGVSAVVEHVESAGEAVLGAVRDAVTAIPLLAPDAPFSAAINGVVDAAATALGAARPGTR
ncbi:hypothetical protein [Nocardia brasiliensis]|uniref:hypothetical protein n=1 Tax=Nocardia brasiliensis TaxID=37326 RepID=UPI0024567598|nr:hypothetical protein [Nocardia brasiliensis]